MNCPFCSSEHHKLRHKIKAYEYRICQQCKVTFLSPFPNSEDIKKWYTDQNYFTQENGNSGYVDYLALQNSLKRTFIRRNKFLGDQSWWVSKKILEIGCALGFYPETLKDIPGLEYTGIDLNAYAVKVVQQKSFRAIHGDIKVIQERNYYDLIVFFDVIEHVVEPFKFLENIRKTLKIGGKILLTTPSTSSLLSRLSGSKWVSYITPHHVLLYQPVAITKLLNACGFEKVKIIPDVQWVPLSFLNDRLTAFFPFLNSLTNRFKDMEKQGKSFLMPVFNGNMLVHAIKSN